MSSLPFQLFLLIITGYLIFRKRRRTSPQDDTTNPIQGLRHEYLPWLRARIRSYSNTSKWLAEGYLKYSLSNKPFIVPALDHGQIIVLPQQQVRKVYGLPESILDVHNVQNESMQMHYTFPDTLLHQEQIHISVIRNQLTRNIPKLTTTVAGEIAFGLERTWGCDIEWREVHVWQSSLGIMAGAANGAFCGQPLCRNTAFLGRLQQHAMTIFGGSIALSCLPKPLQPVFGPLLTLASQLVGSRVIKFTRPVIKKRLEQTAMLSKDPSFDWLPPQDALQWMIDECYASPNSKENLDLDRLCQRLLIVNDVSLLSTSYTAQNVLLDLFATNPEQGYVDRIREECEEALANAGGFWTPSAVKELKLLDSAIRESMRVNPFGSLILPRKVVSPDGISMDNWKGRLPQGSRIAVPVEPIHRDERKYRDADRYDPFRFVTFKCDKPTRVKDVKSAVTLDDSFLGFGIAGRNACPGRFFALLELKILIASILIHYEVGFIRSRPSPVHTMWMRYPSDSKMYVRRRPTTANS